MTPVTVNLGCRRHDEGHDVQAWTTVAPGLVVHAPMVCPGAGADANWCVTHARSGGAVARVSGPEEGQFVAELLGRCGNWDRPATEITKDKAMSLLISKIQQDWPSGGGRGVRSVPERMSA